MSIFLRRGQSPMSMHVHYPLWWSENYIGILIFTIHSYTEKFLPNFVVYMNSGDNILSRRGDAPLPHTLNEECWYTPPYDVASYLGALSLV